MRLAWAEFTLWVEDNVQERSAVIKSFLDQVNSMVGDLNQQKFDSLLQNPLLTELMILWQDFLEDLRHNNGGLSAYWMSYIDIVEDVVCGLLHGSREGNWDLHLNAIRTMIPWCLPMIR